MFPIVILSITDDDDREFMMRLYINYHKLMRKEAYKILGRTAPIEDLVHDACVKLIDKISTLQELDSFRLHSYIVFTIRNVVRDFIKHSEVQKKHTYLGMENDVKDNIANTADDADEIERFIIYEDNTQSLKAALSELSERDRQLLECKYILYMRNEEIAARFNIQPASVREYLSRARKRALSAIEGKRITNVT